MNIATGLPITGTISVKQCPVLKCFDDGKLHKVGRRKKVDDETVYVELAASPLRKATGEITGAIVLSRDITHRKRAEEALEESRQQLADIIDFLPDATFVIDREGKVIAWNRAMEEMTGTGAAAMLGKGDYEYALPFYGERKPLLIDLVLDPGESLEAKYLPMEKTGCILTGGFHLPISGDEKRIFSARRALFMTPKEMSPGRSNRYGILRARNAWKKRLPRPKKNTGRYSKIL